MKVWIIVYQDWDNVEIERVCLSLEEAEQEKKKIVEENIKILRSTNRIPENDFENYWRIVQKDVSTSKIS